MHPCLQFKQLLNVYLKRKIYQNYRSQRCFQLLPTAFPKPTSVSVAITTLSISKLVPVAVRSQEVKGPPAH